MVILYPEQVKGTRRRKNTWLRFCTSCARGCLLTAFCCLQFFRRSGKILEDTVTITTKVSRISHVGIIFRIRYQIEDGYDVSAISGAADYAILQAWDMTHGIRQETPTKALQHSVLHRDPGAAVRDQKYDNIVRDFCTVLNLNAKTPIQMKTKAEFAQPYHKLWLVRKDESITIRCNINNRENFPENSLSHHSFRKIHVELMLNEINKYSKSAWI